MNYTLSLSLTGNTGLQSAAAARRGRHRHDPRGSGGVRSALNNDLTLQRHVLKANAMWDLPDLHAQAAPATSSAVVNDWQLSGIADGGLGLRRYDLTDRQVQSGYTYQNNAATRRNLTGSPDYAAKIVYVGDPGKGCSDNQYAQFNAAAVTGPTYGSVGLESGRNILSSCPDKTVDLSLARNIRVGGARHSSSGWMPSTRSTSW